MGFNSALMGSIVSIRPTAFTFPGCFPVPIVSWDGLGADGCGVGMSGSCFSWPAFNRDFGYLRNVPVVIVID